MAQFAGFRSQFSFDDKNVKILWIHNQDANCTSEINIQFGNIFEVFFILFVKEIDVSMGSLNTGMPTDTDLTMEKAAEAGNQYFENIIGLDLEGAYIYMSYNPGTETFPRAFWAGDVLFQKEQTPESTRWTYMMDAVTVFTQPSPQHSWGKGINRQNPGGGQNRAVPGGSGPSIVTCLSFFYNNF